MVDPKILLRTDLGGDLENYPLPPEVLERSLGVLDGLPKPPEEGSD
jgi:hypothetical protein